ncbi:Transposase IS200 like [Candidatus Kryptobacter tengchongensis]|nr:Transposase IS200 like [Candidatus Kryptobacter tengchongensis]
MPDHLHLVLEGNSEEADLWKAIVYFKQKTGYWLSRNGWDAKWQKDFYDHILRKDEDLKKHIRYILENPVRKGLTNDWMNYEFKGSIDYDLSDIL